VVIDPDPGQSPTPSKYPRIDSITEQVVTECVRDDHFEAIKRSHALDELEGKEVCVLSALHGIRVATEIVNGPALEIDRDRRDHFQELRREYDYPLDGFFSSQA
jgi:hypothetical protein